MASIKEIIIRLTTRGDKTAKRNVSGLEKQIVSLAKSALTLAAAYKGVTFALESVKLAGKLKDLETAHKNLAKAQGLNAKVMIDQMQKATKGTVSELDLLVQANNALLLGLPVSEQDMGKLADAGRRLGRAMGIDAAKGLESLVVGIGRQSKLWLDNLGIIVDTDKAYKNFAKELGKQVGALTDAEKKLAFYGATMDSIDSKMVQLGEDQETVTDKMEQATVAYEKAQTALGTAIAPAATKGVSFLTDAINTLTLSISEKGLIGTLKGALNPIKAITDLAFAQAIAFDFAASGQERLNKALKDKPPTKAELAEIEAARLLAEEQKKFKDVQDKILLNQANRLINEQALLDLKQRGLVAYTEEEIKERAILEANMAKLPILEAVGREHALIIAGLGEEDHLANAVAAATGRWAREAAEVKDQIFMAANSLSQIIQMVTGARKFSLSGLLGIGAGIAALIPGGQGIAFGLGVGSTALRGLQGGGRVDAGEPIIVGENRRELFIPDTAGTILPEVPSGNLTIIVQGAFVGNIDEFAEEIARRSNQNFNRIAVNA